MTSRARLIAPVLILASAASLAACGEEPGPTNAPDSAALVKQRAIDAQTTRKRTGAEIQDRITNRVVRAVYICNNGERLSVDFDNARQMATIRQSTGEAVDLRQERAADGIWYLASGYELRGSGGMATWTAGDRGPTECRAVD